MAQPLRLAAAAAMTLALIATTPTFAQKSFRNDAIIGSSVSLGCAIDHTRVRDTRMIVTNTSGRTVAAGSTLSWRTDDDSGAFSLPRAIPAGQLYSFGLNTKWETCTARATPPQPVLSN